MTILYLYYDAKRHREKERERKKERERERENGQERQRGIYRVNQNICMDVSINECV